MKKIVAAVALGALALPGAAVAAPSGAAKSEGKRECAALKSAAETRANFVQVVRLEAKKVNKGNVVSKCVAARTAEARQEKRESRSAAFAMCESLKPGSATRGENAQRGRAYGKCVSENARKKNAEADAEQREESQNAAKQCRAEQELDPAAFKERHGTNKNKNNAFGKCVSAAAEQNEDEPTEETVA